MSTPAPAQQLGPYELIERIGKGGMGEVWRARDPRLGRDVAIKISAEQFSDRFEREARAIAALNHPNICHLYDVGPNYLVMELIEGEAPKGPLPLDEALNIARQIADALDAAHAKGIVHRDLKPANLKLLPDGSVKVLDFGLAKSGGESQLTSDSPTMLSVTGVILGTAGYMAPEQARGKPVDKRADTWAFGVVLYEMLTGRRLFEGETVSDTLAAVLTREPDFEKTPQTVRRVLKACLERDPKKRLRDIGDWARLLDEEPVASGPAEAQGKTPVVSRGWMAATAVAMLLAASLAVLYFRDRPAPAPALQATILPPENTSFATALGISGVAAVSPDGQHIVFSASARDSKAQLWLRPLGSATGQALAGTEDGVFPFWSADGRSIGFFGKGKLNRLEIGGGQPLAVAGAGDFRGASWSSQGIIVFSAASTGPLRQVAASGGSVRDATRLAPGESTHRWPSFLPDGKHFLFAAGTGGTTRKTIRVGTLGSLESTRLLDVDSNAIYSAGYLLFLRGNLLMAQRFDARNVKLSGEALPVVDGVQLGIPSVGAFSASPGGLLVYTAARADVDLAWFDRKGNRTASVGEPGRFFLPNISPDQRSLAVSVMDPARGNADIWTVDLARGLRTRFTFDGADHRNAVWSPDGAALVFASNAKGHYDLYRRSSNGAGAEELLCADNLEKFPGSISPDSRSLLYYANGSDGSHLWVLPDPLSQSGPGKPYPFARGQNETFGGFSPDGKSIVYQSEESGRTEIYVRPFPGPGGKRQISIAGGVLPRWGRDGKEIFYLGTTTGTLMVTGVTKKDGELQTGETRSLFRSVTSTLGIPYDISADSQRILMLAPPPEASPGLTIIQNWPAGLKK